MASRLGNFFTRHHLLAAAAMSLAAVIGASAAPRTWSGGGADNNWSTAANWGGTAPVSADSLIFAGTQRTTNLNNIASLNNMAGITFNNQNFLFGGNLITNSGGVYDTAGNNTNNLVMYLNASQGFSNIVAGTRTQLGGVVTNIGSGNILNLGGDGQINLNGVLSGIATVNINGPGINRWAAANTFSGPLTINGGTLQLANAAAIPSGNGKGDLTNNGTLDMNGNSQTINGLFGSGIVDQLSGAASVTLTVGNNATNTGGQFFYGGTIQNTAGKIGLTKINTNVFLLGGSPAYSGSTIVSAGTLVLTNGATMPNSSDFTVSPGATFNITNGPFTLGASQTLTAGRSTNGGPADIIGDPNSTGSINIYKAGQTGTLKLSAGLTLNGGIVNFDLGNNTATGGTSNDVIAISGQLTLTGTTTIRLNPIVGSLAVGTYTLITNSTALLSGSAGANLVVQTPRGITATLDTTTFPGSLLVAITGSSTPVALTWSGAVSGDWDVNLTQNWTSNGVPDVFYNLDNVVFNDTNVNATINLPAGVSPGSTLISNNSSNYIFAGIGSITGSGGLTKSGTAQATFRNANSYLGNTVINGGTLQLDVGNAAAPLTQILYNNVTAGTLIMNAGTFTKTSRANLTTYQLFTATTFNQGTSFIFQPGRTSSSTPAIYLGAITRTVGGTVDMEPQTGTGGTQAGATTGIFTTATNNNATVSGIVGGYATWNAAFGTAEFARVNANAGAQGGTHIYGGAIYTNIFANNTNTDMTADLTAANNTNTMSVRFTNASPRTLTLTGTNVITSGGILVGSGVGANQTTITNAALTSGNGQDLIVHQYDTLGNLVIHSIVTDNGATSIALTKTGGGTVVLGGANSYSGLTYINQGTLQVGTGGTAGNLGNALGVTNSGVLAINHSDNVTMNFPVTGSGGLRNLGGGVLTIISTNGYAGPTVVSAGTLQVGAGGVAGNLGSSSVITNNATLVFNRSDAFSFTGPIVGSGTLVKTGASSLTLGGSNTYSGLTVVSNGTLAFGAAASISQSSGFVLSAAGSKIDVSAAGGELALTGGSIAQVLSGIGTVNGSVTVTNNTRLTPATNNLAGTMTITNNLTVAGGTLNMDVGSAVNKDLITVGGALNLNSGSLILKTLGTVANGSYKLIGYASFSGDVANLSFSGFVQAGQVAYLTNNVASSEVDLVVISGSGASLTWVGDGGNNFWDVNISSDWDNGAGSSVFHNNDNVTMNDVSIYPTVVLNANVSPGTVTVNTLVNNYMMSGSGKITGGAGLIINATNTTVTITTPNDNSGASTINTGTVQVGDGATTGNLGIGIVTNKAVVNFNEPADTSVSASFVGAGGIFNQGAPVLALLGDNSAFTGPVTISAGTVNVGGATGSGSIGSGPVTNNGTLVIQRNGALTVNNNITGTGPIIFNGSGTTTFGGNNSYANNTYVSNGVVKLAASAAIPADGTAANWLVLDGSPAAAGTLDLNGNNASVNAISGLNGAVNGMILNSAAATTNTLAIIGTATTTYSGAIKDNAGKVALLVAGTANQTFDIESLVGNAYTGGTIISNATVRIVSSAVGAAANYPNPVGLGSGPVTLYGGSIYAPGSANGNPTWNSLNNAINIPTNQTGTIYGPQRGTVQASITGSGTLTYINTFVRGAINGNWSAFTGQIIWGNTTLGGQLGIANTAGFGRVLCTNTAGTGGVTFYNTVAGTPTIPIGELTDNGTTFIESTSSGNAGGVAANFAVGGLNTSTTFGGGIIDNVGIIKVGSGTWTLTNATLTYSGLTTVSNGVLALGASANLSASTPVTLAAPGILDVSASGTLTLAAQTIQGNGTLNGSLVTGAGTTVSPGRANAIGTLTVTNAVTLAGTTLMELNRTNSPATNDMLAAASVAAGGTLQVNNLASDLHTGDTFKLFSVPVTGSFAITNLPVTTGDGFITYVWTNKLAIDGTIQVLVGVPNVNTNPTNITSVVNGSNLELSWPADHTGWRLQAQTNSLADGLGTNWVAIPGTATVNTYTNTINPANGTVFYRMVYP